MQDSTLPQGYRPRPEIWIVILPLKDPGYGGPAAFGACVMSLEKSSETAKSREPREGDVQSRSDL